MDYRFKCKTLKYKIPRRKHRKKNTCDPGLASDLSDTKAQSFKKKKMEIDRLKFIKI